MKVEIGTYEKPDAIGQIGWIASEKQTIFINLDGTMTTPYDNPVFSDAQKESRTKAVKDRKIA